MREHQISRDTYYVLEDDDSSGIVGGVHEDNPELHNKYARGQLLVDTEQPQNAFVSVEREPAQYPDYFELQATPIASTKFVDAMRRAGVDNFQAFPVPIVEGSRRFHGYSIINFVGRVSCLDEAETRCTRFKGRVARMQRLVIDEHRTHDIPLFRLHEYELLVLVHARVQTILRGLPGVVLSSALGWSDGHRF